MACSSATAASSINAATLSSSPHFLFSCFFPNKSIFVASGLPGNLPFPRNRRFDSSALCFSRRQKHGSSPSQRAKPPQRKKKKQISPKSHGSEEDELDEDAFEALFKQLEEDLKNDDLSFDDIEDDISEEDLAKLEQELAEALDDDELQMSISNAEVTEHDDDAKAGDDTAEHHDDDDDEEEEEEDEDEDIERPAEALFKQLEEDLKNDDPSLDDIEDDISEEGLARLERELAEALADDELQMSLSNAEATEHDDDDDDEDIERPVELKRWQLRRLATALKTGRRKTSIKNLAAELCLERAVVLELLRDPPPNLLMMSAMLPDEAPESEVVPENRTVEVATPRAVPEAKDHKTPPKVKVPLHVMRQTWSSQKRLKKAQVQTLERVYRRTKRPTNAMISSIVHVTSLPRKRIIKWFEDKRAEDGVPNQRLPYERPVPDTVG